MAAWRWTGPPCWARPCAPRLALPTYAVPAPAVLAADAAAGAGDVAARWASVPADHPLLGAAVSLADGDGVLLTGRLSLSLQPWLADHAVSGSVLLPGTAFVELAVHAGDQVGCDLVEELTLQTPLVLPEQGGVQVQVWVGDPDEDGRRPVNVYSRIEGAAGFVDPARHRCAQPRRPAGPRPGWRRGHRPVRRPVAVDGLYERLAGGGYGYGPVFQGLRAVWQSGADVLRRGGAARAGHAADGFGVHPAVLDAALHPIAVTGLAGDGAAVVLPFAWSGVRLHATGARVLRVRLSPTDDGGVAVAGVRHRRAAGADRRVVGAAAGDRRPAGRRDPGRGASRCSRWTGCRCPDRRDTGHRELAWAWHGRVAGGAARGGGGRAPGPGPGGRGCRGRARGERAGAGMAAGVAGRSGRGRLRLVVATRGATDGTDLAAAAVWGLVRSAQSEHPDRFILLDLDGDTDRGSEPDGELDGGWARSWRRCWPAANRRSRSGLVCSTPGGWCGPVPAGWPCPARTGRRGGSTCPSRAAWTT